MNDHDRMLNRKLYDPYQTDGNSWEVSRRLLGEYNALPYSQHQKRYGILNQLLGEVYEDSVVTPPFYCDKGYNILLGKHFYANTGLLILDEAPVHFGDHAFLGPRVCIYTACHPIDAQIRNRELEYALPVSIGDNVWIGGNVVINPGVSIGSNTIIGSGSVVTKDIPDNVIAAGNPCRVIRQITEEDHRFWMEQAKKYDEDPDTGRQPE